MTELEVRRLLRKACEYAGSQNEWAELYGISAAYVSDVIRGRRNPGEAILNALGLVKVVSYEIKP